MKRETETELRARAEALRQEMAEGKHRILNSFRIANIGSKIKRLRGQDLQTRRMRETQVEREMERRDVERDTRRRERT